MVPSQYNIWCLAEERLQVERFVLRWDVGFQLFVHYIGVFKFNQLAG